MGITDSKSNNQFAEFLKQYRVVRTIPENHITYLEDINEEGRDCLCRQISVNDEKIYQQYIKDIEEKKKILDHNHLVKLTEYMTGQQKDFCGSYLKIYILFQYPHRTLNEEIVERSTQRTKFQEKELWSIIASCILGMSHLQKHNIKHQCITSEAILVDGSGVIKVADPFCTLESSNYQKMTSKTRPSHIYLSPELCKCLDDAEVSPTADVDPYKSDVFTFGMVMMEAALLKYLDDCYREDNTKINWETIRYYLDQIGQSYSLDLKQMIERLVSDFPKRPDWLELKQFMKDDGETQTQHTKSQPSNPIQYTGLASNPRSPKDPHHLGGVPYRPVSQIPVSQASPKYVTDYVSSTRPPIGVNQPIVHMGPPPVVVSQSYTGQIVPVQPCNINMVRPALGTRPADTYITHTRIDENLIEVSDDEDELQTNESDPSHPQNRLYQPPPYQIPSQNIPHMGAPYNPYNQRINLQPQIDSRYKYSGPPISHNTIGSQPAQVVSSIPNISTSIGGIMSPSVYTKDYTSTIVTGGPRYGTTMHTGGLPHHNPSFNKPAGSQLPGVVFNGSTPPVYKPVDNSNLFTDYQKLGIKKNDNTFVTTQFQPPSHYMRPEDNYRPPSHNLETRKVAPPTQSPAPQVQRVVQKFSQGSRYQGQKVNGMRHGKGKFYYQDGGSYDGEWRENKMCGKGKLLYQSGKIAYDGDWQNDQFAGYGILYNEHPQSLNKPYDYRNFDDMEEVWTKFEGHFVDDMKQGEGKLFFSNGEYYEGHFEADVINGKGTFHTMDGEKVIGVWRDNHLVQAFN